MTLTITNVVPKPSPMPINHHPDSYVSLNGKLCPIIAHSHIPVSLPSMHWALVFSCLNCIAINIEQKHKKNPFVNIRHFIESPTSQTISIEVNKWHVHSVT